MQNSDDLGSAEENELVLLFTWTACPRRGYPSAKSRLWPGYKENHVACGLSSFHGFPINRNLSHRKSLFIFWVTNYPPRNSLAKKERKREEGGERGREGGRERRWENRLKSRQINTKTNTKKEKNIRLKLPNAKCQPPQWRKAAFTYIIPLTRLVLSFYSLFCHLRELGRYTSQGFKKNPKFIPKPPYARLKTKLSSICAQQQLNSNNYTETSSAEGLGVFVFRNSQSLSKLCKSCQLSLVLFGALLVHRSWG